MEEQLGTIDPTYRGNIWCTPQERRDWRLYLTDLDDDPKNHIEAVDMIRTAEEEDVVEILLTSPGGRCDIADMYLAAIADSKAKIITRAIGECCSAAATIFLAGDERVCDNGCYFMFHNVQFGVAGDSAHVFNKSRFYERLFKEKSYGMMSEVLTKEELDELFNRAGEVYLTAEEMRQRLQNSERREQIIDRLGPGTLPPTTTEEEPQLSPGDWWGLVKKEAEGILSMPFPETKVKSAEDFPQGDEFDITLNDGYKKTFRLSTICHKDFDEYNMEEIEEIGIEAFGVSLAGMTRSQALEELIDEIRNGGGEQ